MKPKVLFVASEVTPLAKVGGLGDVMGALPKALKALGADARILTGYYGTHDETKYPTQVRGTFVVPWGGREVIATLREAALPGTDVPVYLIDEANIVGTGGVYDSRTAFASGQEELERFLFICKAAVQVPDVLSWQPDLWHLQDWHASAVTAFLTEPHAPTLLTIHNLANQGWAGPETVRRSGLPIKADTGDLNLFRLGLTRATFLSTVSPTYAAEIQSAPEGEGLEQVLASRAHELVGITNGIDTDFFNPAADPFLATTYDEASAGVGKAENRQALASELGLEQSDVPLVGIVSRFTNQKGIELIPEALRLALETRQLQFAFLGVGDPALEKLMTELSEAYPGYAGGGIKFDERLAHRIYAGSDFFLMPSRFEPCGLGQLIAMRYGAVPVVRATGGLKDTVVDASEADGTGVVFQSYDAEALRRAVERALTIHRDRATMEAVRQRAFGRDSSWGRAASEYLALYTKLCLETRPN